MARALTRLSARSAFSLNPKPKTRNSKLETTMSTETLKSDYMLLFRSTQWDKDLSAEEIREVMSRWRAWFERLTQEGKVKSGHPLADQGKVVSGARGVSVADGPFAE